MKYLVTIVLALLTAFAASAVELPSKPTGTSSLSISMFGTTENPANPPDYRFFVYEMRDDALLTSNLNGKEEGKIKKRISPTEYAALFTEFKQFFDSHKVNEDRNLTADGSSIKIEMHFESSSASITFDHNSFKNSKELKILLKAIESSHSGSTRTLIQALKQ